LLFTRRQVAALYGGIHPATIKRWEGDRLTPITFTPGGTVFYAAKQVMALASGGDDE
jgi:hypothetical protein